MSLDCLFFVIEMFHFLFMRYVCVHLYLRTSVYIHFQKGIPPFSYLMSVSCILFVYMFDIYVFCTYNFGISFCCFLWRILSTFIFFSTNSCASGRILFRPTIIFNCLPCSYCSFVWLPFLALNFNSQDSAIT